MEGESSLIDRIVERARQVRISTRLFFIFVILMAAIARRSCGTTCSLGIGNFTLTCPLGYLQMSMASRSLIPALLISVGVVVLVSAILGRFFCSWICPAGLLQGLFNGRGKRSASNGNSRRMSRNNAGHSSNLSAKAPIGTQGQGIRRQSSTYAVLGGTLLSSFIFGFPVFCAICPVGLTFGTLFAMKGLFQTGELGLELVLFPLLLGVELYVLRSWCQSLCPLGALLGILGSRSRVLLPVIRRAKCFIEKDVDCQVCRRVCPEGIDLIMDTPRVVQQNCTRCMDCYTDCPTEAITLVGARSANAGWD
ncbi:MAG: 4Fe-4S binding protein [Anaerolineales bacterium]|nr:4Fe-4S binding protein [Anaerolineales bacterium]